MWHFLVSQVIAQQNYIHITPQTKVNLERRISNISISERPQITPSEVSAILNGRQPQKCSTNPQQQYSQIICLWVEGERMIEVFYHGGDTTPRWTFQRWKASGDW